MDDTVYPVAKFVQNVAVIGAAIDGLVAANYVQRARHRITLLERGDRDGGTWRLRLLFCRLGPAALSQAKTGRTLLGYKRRQ